MAAASPSIAEHAPAADPPEVAPEAEDEELPYYVMYQKKCYLVPEHCIKFNKKKPVKVESGEAMGEVHDSKAPKKWVDAGVSWRNFIVVEVELDGETKQGIYVTFTTDVESDDIAIMRPVHKAVIKSFMEEWDAWSEEKKGKYPELANFALGEDAQISPVEQRWDQVKADLPESLYQKPKAQQRQFTAKSAAGQSRGVAGGIGKKATGPSKAAKKAAAAAAAEAEAEEEGGEEEMEQEAAPRAAAGSVGSGRTVTISEELFDKMAAAYWGRRA